MKRNYLINCEDRNGVQKASLALATAFKLMNNLPIKNVVIVCPNIKNLIHNDIGEAINSFNLSSFTASRLKRHEPVKIANTRFEAIPSSKIAQIRDIDIVIADCLSPRDMELIDKLEGIKFVIYIPYHSGESELWKSKNNAEVI
ncbi:TPA: hypothetical protein ACQ105_001155 [Acinetobacter baumannii]